MDTGRDGRWVEVVRVREGREPLPMLVCRLGSVDVAVLHQRPPMSRELLLVKRYLQQGHSPQLTAEDVEPILCAP